MNRINLDLYECEVCGYQFHGPQIISESIEVTCPCCGEELILECSILSEGSVTISSYMKSRRYNRKLYDKLVKQLEKIVDTYKELSPDLKLVISMSAKYQTPYISVSDYDGGDEDSIEYDIIDALDDVGFSYTSVDVTHNGIRINFNDE